MSAATIFFSHNSYLTEIAEITEAALIAHNVSFAAEAPPETTEPPLVMLPPRIHDLAIFD